jgi:hypothetical protein
MASGPADEKNGDDLFNINNDKIQHAHHSESLGELIV